jgi:hypothetical protein
MPAGYSPDGSAPALAGATMATKPMKASDSTSQEDLMAGTPKLRFGLFGTGYWAGQVHAAALTMAPEARLVGIWGRDRFRTAAIAAPYGIAAYDDADALIEDVDAVSAALPPDVQVSVAVRAAQAGRHLLLEKPLALSASGADELLGAVTSAGVASLVFFTSRFVPAVDEVLRDAVPALARAAGELARAAAGLSGGHVCDVRFGWEVNAVLTAAAESIATGRGVAVRPVQSMTSAVAGP